tara:strand:- start:78 stop:926 length:849 start_codon:yes stop_codon:yes gene_type:complete
MRKGVDNSRLQGSEYGGSLSNEEANAAKSGSTKLRNNAQNIAKQVAMTGASLGMAAAMPSIIATGKGVQAASAANKAARAAQAAAKASQGLMGSMGTGTSMLSAGAGLLGGPAATSALSTAGTLASGAAGTGSLAAGTAATVGVGAPVAAQKGSNLLQGAKKAKELVDTVDQVVDTGKQVAQMFEQPADYKTGNNYGSYSRNNKNMMTSQMQQMGLPQYDNLGNQNFFTEGGQYKIGSPATPAGFSPEVHQQYGLGFDPKSAPAVTPSGPTLLSPVYNPAGH